ncbi:uncharacterized protein EKO05_0011362 [Ascochyta rabiei]|uniref:uncharacterized protein n=1 Tax=Didymella rabiei TaxID=5454 RepID=UPI0022012101|nr:uncharacterized protein EKO05_0011362 [Ascochyta rabiei]UPX21165.1 hypothetical protein EKO05_0011362 [Ascochyta rabiei]
MPQHRQVSIKQDEVLNASLHMTCNLKRHYTTPAMFVKAAEHQQWVYSVTREGGCERK